MQKWWKECVAEMQAEGDMELDSKVSAILSRGLDTVNDRLENGDFILDSKKGEIIRVPVKMKDAHKVATDLIDQRNVLRGKVVTKTDKGTIEDTMLKLADQFKEWAKLIKRDENVIEGELLDAENIDSTDQPIEIQGSTELESNSSEEAGRVQDNGLEGEPNSQRQGAEFNVTGREGEGQSEQILWKA